MSEAVGLSALLNGGPEVLQEANRRMVSQPSDGLPPIPSSTLGRPGDPLTEALLTQTVVTKVGSQEELDKLTASLQQQGVSTFTVERAPDGGMVVVAKVPGWLYNNWPKVLGAAGIGAAAALGGPALAAWLGSMGSSAWSWLHGVVNKLAPITSQVGRVAQGAANRIGNNVRAMHDMATDPNAQYTMRFDPDFTGESYDPHDGEALTEERQPGILNDVIIFRPNDPQSLPALTAYLDEQGMQYAVEEAPDGTPVIAISKPTWFSKNWKPILATLVGFGVTVLAGAALVMWVSGFGAAAPLFLKKMAMVFGMGSMGGSVGQLAGYGVGRGISGPGPGAEVGRFGGGLAGTMAGVGLGAGAAAALMQSDSYDPTSPQLTEDQVAFSFNDETIADKVRAALTKAGIKNGIRKEGDGTAQVFISPQDLQRAKQVAKKAGEPMRASGALGWVADKLGIESMQEAVEDPLSSTVPEMGQYTQPGGGIGDAGTPYGVSAYGVPDGQALGGEIGPNSQEYKPPFPGAPTNPYKGDGSDDTVVAPLGGEPKYDVSDLDALLPDMDQMNMDHERDPRQGLLPGSGLGHTVEMMPGGYDYGVFQPHPYAQVTYDQPPSQRQGQPKPDKQNDVESVLDQVAALTEQVPLQPDETDSRWVVLTLASEQEAKDFAAVLQSAGVVPVVYGGPGPHSQEIAFPSSMWDPAWLDSFLKQSGLTAEVKPPKQSGMGHSIMMGIKNAVTGVGRALKPFAGLAGAVGVGALGGAAVAMGRSLMQSDSYDPTDPNALNEMGRAVAREQGFRNNAKNAGQQGNPIHDWEGTLPAQGEMAPPHYLDTDGQLTFPTEYPDMRIAGSTQPDEDGGEHQKESLAVSPEVLSAIRLVREGHDPHDVLRVLASAPSVRLREKWGNDAEIEQTGEHKDKSVAELRKAYDALKDKKDKSETESKKLKQLAFAIRAKTGFGKVDK